MTYRWLRGKYASARSHFRTRRIIAFRHTLFWHVGDASAVGNSAQRHKPKCYGLTKEWLFEQESFHEDECPDDDLWPCGNAFRPEAGSAMLFGGKVTHAGLEITSGRRVVFVASFSPLGGRQQRAEEAARSRDIYGDLT